MRIKESLVTDKQIALELHSENGKFRLPIDGQDHYFPNLKKVHEAFLNQNTYDTIKLTHLGKKSYLHLFMDEIEVFDTKKALRRRLSQDSQGMWAEIRNGKKHYYMQQRGWLSTSYKEITEQECIQKLQHTSTMTKALGIGLGMLALLPGAFEFARRLPIGTKEAAMGLVALNQKSPVLGAVGYSLLPTKVDAQAEGTEFQINTYTTGDQRTPSIAPLNDGGFVVTWESYYQDGDSVGIYGQKYDSSGAANGAEFQVNTYTASSQIEPSAAPLNDGGFVVTWSSNGQDGNLNGIYGQRYDNNGSPAGAEFQVNTYTTDVQREPSVALLKDGSFVITWHSLEQDGDSYGIYGQRYDASGVAIGTEFRVNTYTTNSQIYPSIAPLSDGGFVITWSSDGQDGDFYGVYGQRYDSAGGAVGPEFQINTYTTSSQSNPSIAPLNDGGFVITWSSDGQDGDSYGVYGQRYDASGVAIGTEFQVNTYTTSNQWLSSIAPLNDGGFIVTWESDGQDGDINGIFARRYDSSGTTVGAEFQVNTYTTRIQSNPSTAPLSDGGFVITWESGTFRRGWMSSTIPVRQDGDGSGIFGQRYDATGKPIPLQFGITTIITPSPSATPSSLSLNTPTRPLVSTQSASTRSTPLLSNSPSPTQVITTGMPPSSTAATATLSTTPNRSTTLPTSTPSPTQVITPSLPPSSTTPSTMQSLNSIRSTTLPSSTPSPTPVITTSMPPSSTTASATPSPTSIRSTTSPSSTPSPTPATTGSILRSTTVTSAAPSSSTQAALSTPSSWTATSTSAAIMPTSSTLGIGSVETIVYGQSYPLLINDEIVGTYTVSGGTGSLNSGNLSVISFDFDPGFQPEEGDVITLFYIPEEDVALWESIEIEGETFECLTTYGQIVTINGLSSFQVFFEDTECVASAPTLLATALPITLN